MKKWWAKRKKKCWQSELTGLHAHNPNPDEIIATTYLKLVSAGYIHPVFVDVYLISAGLLTVFNEVFGSLEQTIQTKPLSSPNKRNCANHSYKSGQSFLPAGVVCSPDAWMKFQPFASLQTTNMSHKSIWNILISSVVCVRELGNKLYFRISHFLFLSVYYQPRSFGASTPHSFVLILN